MTMAKFSVLYIHTLLKALLCNTCETNTALELFSKNNGYFARKC